MALIRLLILDVDGVLTNGDLYYEGSAASLKPFYVQDGLALRLWQSAGGQTALLSGRAAEAVSARARELGIETVIQGVSDKLGAYEDIRQRQGLSDGEIAVVGDDLPDLPVLARCGYPIAVANAHRRVKRAACYVTARPGGGGAVPEAVERLLRHNGTWREAIGRFCG